jgi:hypothetical protein
MGELLYSNFRFVFLGLLSFLCFDAFAQISGSDTICQGVGATFSVSNAGSKQWSQNGASLPNQTSGSFIFTPISLGTFTISCAVTNGGTTTTYTKQTLVIANPSPSIEPFDKNLCYFFGGSEAAGSNDLGNCNQQVCSGTVYKYIAKGSASSSYTWILPPNASIIATDNNNYDTVSILYNSLGRFSLSVKETSYNGCIGYGSLCVQVIPNPVSCFTTTPSMDGLNVINVCQNAPVSFDASCSSTPVGSVLQTNQWFFGDGSFTANKYFVSHTYSTPGTYTVKLVLESNCHCTDTFTATVNVAEGVSPDITCISTVCFGDTATYKTTDTCTDLVWGVSNGSVIGSNTLDSLKVIWNDGSNGFGVITLQDNCSGHCNIPTVVQVPILPQNATIVGDEHVCPGETSVYSVPYIPSTVYTWTSSGGYVNTSLGQDKQYRCQVTWPSSAITGSVSVTYENPFLGCGGNATKNVEVMPELKLYGNLKVCEYDSVKVIAYYRDASNNYHPVDCSWKLYSMPAKTLISSSYPVSYYFAQLGLSPGSYLLEADVVPTAYCNTPLSYEFEVVAAPSAISGTIAGDDYVCIGTPYTYTTSASSLSNYVEWKATDGLPQSATGNTANISWNTPTSQAKIQARQVMFDEPRCASSWITKQIYPLNLSLSITGPDSVCSDQNVDFTSSISDADWVEWRIIPATAGTVTPSSNESTASILWNNVSSYTNATIWQVVEKCGIRDSISKNITIKPAPNVAIIFPSQICQSASSSFSTTTTGSNFEWDFQKINSSLTPITATGSSTSVNFTEEGSWTAHLKVTAPGGCPLPAHAWQTVNVMPAPAAVLTSPQTANRCNASSGWSNDLVVTLQNMNSSTFTFQFYDQSNTAVSSSGNIATVGTIDTYYAIVTNTFGCSATTNTFTISDCPSGGGGGGCTSTAALTTSATNSCGVVSYTATVSSGTFVGWSFTDPNSGRTKGSSSASDTFHYSKAGYYHATATATDTNSCDKTSTVITTVPLVADFIVRFACDGSNAFSTNLIDVSTYLSAITAWSWTVKHSGTTVATSSNDSCFLAAHRGETIEVTLTISNASGSCSFTKNIQVPEAVTANFTVEDTVCENTPIQFIWSGAGDAVDFEWKFTDKYIVYSKSNLSFHQFQKPTSSSIGKIRLTVFDKYGCSSSNSDLLTIFQNKLGVNSINPTITLGCEGDIDTIYVVQSCGGCNISTLSSAISYKWSDGTITTNNKLSPVSTGSYRVTVFDIYGCHSNSANAPVFYSPLPPAVINGDTAICEGTQPNLTLFAGHQYTYTWFLKLSGSSTFSNVTQTTNPFKLNLAGGMSNYYDNAQVFGIIAESATGCIDTTPVRRLHLLTKPNILPVTTSTGLQCLTGGGLLTLIAHASSAGTFKWSNGYVGDSIKVSQGGSYGVQFTDANGCESIFSNIGVYPASDFSQLIYGCYDFCIGTSVTIPGPTNALPGSLFQWLKDGVPVSPNAPVTLPDLDVSGSGQYRLIIHDGSYTCSDTSKPIDINFIPCSNDSCMTVSAQCASCHQDTAAGGLRYYEYRLPVAYFGSIDTAALYVEVFINGNAVAAQYWNESNPDAAVALHNAATNDVIHLVFIDEQVFDEQACVVLTTVDCTHTYCFPLNCSGSGGSSARMAQPQQDDMVLKRNRKGKGAENATQKKRNQKIEETQFDTKTKR